MEPVAVLGIPLYNHAELLPAALDSLLGQERRDLALVLVDDLSTDATPDVARAYAARDPRVVYECNRARLGLVGNWRRAFERATELHPGAPYFAWASDHDLWDPRWLGALVAELERSPAALVAYPHTVRMGAGGETIRGSWSFSTAGMDSPAERLAASCRRMVPGDMVYGLFRAEALRRAGVFPAVVAPDRLLLSELSVYGELHQVPEVLWRRRYQHAVSVRRQRASFFPAGAPLHAYLPWWLVHAGVLGWRLGVRGGARPAMGRPGGVVCAGLYGALCAGLEARRRTRRAYYRARRSLLRKRARIWQHRIRKLVRSQGRRARGVLKGGRRG